MESTTSALPKPGEFFILEAGTINGPVNGVVFENVKHLLSPPAPDSEARSWWLPSTARNPAFGL